MLAEQNSATIVFDLPRCVESYTFYLVKVRFHVDRSGFMLTSGQGQVTAGQISTLT